MTQRATPGLCRCAMHTHAVQLGGNLDWPVWLSGANRRPAPNVHTQRLRDLLSIVVILLCHAARGSTAHHGKWAPPHHSSPGVMQRTPHACMPATLHQGHGAAAERAVRPAPVVLGVGRNGQAGGLHAECAGAQVGLARPHSRPQRRGAASAARRGLSGRASARCAQPERRRRGAPQCTAPGRARTRCC